MLKLDDPSQAIQMLPALLRSAEYQAPLRLALIGFQSSVSTRYDISQLQLSNEHPQDGLLSLLHPRTLPDRDR